MKNHTLKALFVAASVVALPALASAAETVGPDTWEAHLNVTDGASRTKVSFGMRKSATDGFDLAWAHV